MNVVVEKVLMCSFKNIDSIDFNKPMFVETDLNICQYIKNFKFIEEYNANHSFSTCRDEYFTQCLNNKNIAIKCIEYFICKRVISDKDTIFLENLIYSKYTQYISILEKIKLLK